MSALTANEDIDGQVESERPWSSYGQVRFPPRHMTRLTGLDVVSALVTPPFGTCGSSNERAQKYTGYMKKQQRLPPYLWRRRWVEVWLEPFGSVSRLVVRDELASAMVSSMVAIRRNSQGEHDAFKKLVLHDNGSVEFEFIDREQHKIRLRSMQRCTPSPLLAALSALSWPNGSVDDSRRAAHKLVVALGDPSNALRVEESVLRDEEALIARYGIREMRVPEDANQGDEIGHGYRVPAGVGRGALFYVVNDGPSDTEQGPSVQVDEATEELIERAVAANLIDHSSASRMRRSGIQQDSLRRMLSARLGNLDAPVVCDEDEHHDHLANGDGATPAALADDDDNTSDGEDDAERERSAAEVSVEASAGTASIPADAPPDSIPIDECESYSGNGSYLRQLTHLTTQQPRSFVRTLTKTGLEWKATLCPSMLPRQEPSEPERWPKPRTVRHKARARIPPAARPGYRLAVRVPQRDEPVMVMVPREARPGSTLELTYAVVTCEKYPAFPYHNPEKAPAWRREHLESRLACLRIGWNDVYPRSERVEIVCERGSTFLDSVLRRLPTRAELWRTQWRFAFRDEPALDAGGVAREFWTLISLQLFSPDYGLFAYAANDNLSYRLSPIAHSVFSSRDIARLYRICGRLLAKALLDRQTLEAPLNRPLLKHILSVAVCFEDLQFVDAALYHNLDWLRSTEDDVSLLCQTFTVTEEMFGVTREVELIPGGAKIDVNASNKINYVEKRFQYAMMNPKVEPALFNLLTGFYEVVPLATLLGGDGPTPDDNATSLTSPERIDAQELEVILFGTGTIDPDDWMKHTTYRRLTPSSRRVRHFWRLVKEFDPTLRVRLLQWSTGTARVPAGGFAKLQGAAGQLKQFELAAADDAAERDDDTKFPRSHTCFNRIDLPAYQTYEHMRQVFIAILSNDITGFSLE